MTLPKISSPFPLFAVGGFVRDSVLGKSSKDLDLVMLAPSFEEMKQSIVDMGGTIFQERPEFQVIRCKVPDIGPVDVALPRVDGNYSDGRHPDSTVIAESIEQDLSRRDFTMNAIAMNLETGKLVDPFGGVYHIKMGYITTVGDPMERFREDMLRVIRAVRFWHKLGFDMGFDTRCAIEYLVSTSTFESVATERLYDELVKMFNHDPYSALRTIERFDLMRLFMTRGIWFKPSLEKR